MRLVAVLLVLSAALAAAGDAARPRVAGQIVFASERGSTFENSELYSVGVDGSRRRALTRNPDGADAGARWSPDGALIAYVSERVAGGVRGLYVMRPDGRAQRRLTPRGLAVTSDFDVPPSWSPDGTRLVFSGELRSRPGIWTIRMNGSRLRQIARGGAGPLWSPRGNRIAFVDSGRVLVVPARGGAVRRVSRGPYDGLPAWSPDARTIAFVRSDANGSSQTVHLVSAGGGPLRQVFGGAADVGHPRWSPDGRRLLFQASETLYVVRVRGRAVSRLRRGAWPVWSPDGRRIAFSLASGLYVMSANGKGVRRVRNERGRELLAGPAWSPDGRTLVYATTQTRSDLEVFVVNADGSRLRQLTHNSVQDLAPAWSPARKRIAFVSRGAVWLMRADGSGRRRLVAGTEPAWSPQGTQLAFTSAGSLYLVSSGGGVSTRVAEGRSAAWSPRGTEIAFVRGLRLMAADLRSRAERTIVDVTSACPDRSYEATLYGPDWSPDARRLVYAVGCDDGRFLSVSAEIIQADGGERQPLPLGALDGSRLAWSPDGARIAFISEDPRRRVGTARLDGTGRTTVVADPAGAAYLDPDW